MEKLQKPEYNNLKKLLKLFTIACLLIIAPLLSTSLRFKYLYFILNILIILVGAEAGLLSFFLQSDQKNPDHLVINNKDNHYTDQSGGTHNSASADHEPVKKKKKPPVVGKCSSEKILAGDREAASVKKSSSSPSIFFIGDDDMMMKDNEDDDGEDVSGQELFKKAEMFIGDFYKQLKMQREESWNKLNGRLSQKAF